MANLFGKKLKNVIPELLTKGPNGTIQDAQGNEFIIEGIVEQAAKGIEPFDTKASMDATTPASGDSEIALVMNDTAANNGYYRYDSGTSSWVKRDDFYANTIDAEDTSEAVTGKAVADFSLEKIVASKKDTLSAGELKEITNHNESNYKVTTTDGSASSDGNYDMYGFSVEPGDVIYYTGALIGDQSNNVDPRGVAGYSQQALSTFLDEKDEYGLNVGALWSNNRAKEEYGIPYPTSETDSYGIYEDVPIVIPAGCHYVRACSYRPEKALSVKKESKTLRTVNTRLDDLSDNVLLKGFKPEVKTNGGKVVTSDGTIESDTSWDITGFIPVEPGQKIIYSGALTGSTLGGAFDSRGIAGYDNDKVFLSATDSEGLPKGALWDNDRWAIKNGEPYTDNTKWYTEVEITIPDGCHYIRACSYNTQKSLDIEIIYNDAVPIKEYVDKEVQKAPKSAGIINRLDDSINEFRNDNAAFDSDLTVTPAEYTVRNDGTHSKGWVEWSIYSEAIKNADTVYLTGYFKADKTNLLSIDFAWTPGDGTGLHGRVKNTGLLDSTNEWQFASIKYDIPADPSEIYFIYLQINNATGNTTDAVYYKDLLLSEHPINEANFPMGDIGGGGGGSNFKTKMSDAVLPYTYTPVPGGPREKRFTFIHFSDVHYFGNNAQKNMLEMIDFADNTPAGNEIDAIVSTGDNCNGDNGRDYNVTDNEITSYVDDLLTASKPTLNLVGNHDKDNFLTGDRDISEIHSDSDLYSKMFQPFENKFSGIHGVANKCYYYADFSDAKIRFIGLDCYNLPQDTDGQGNGKYDNASGNYYSQDQIDWLETTLQNTPNDYAVVFLNHGTIIEGHDFYSYEQGWDFIPSVIDAWKNGSTYTHDYSNSTYPVLDTHKDFDFTTRGSGEFICLLAGHVHTFNHLQNDLFNDQNVIMAACTKTSSSGGQIAAKNIGQIRGNSDELRNSFNVISIDREHKNIYLTVYGAYKDMMGKIKDRSITISYG